MATDKSYESLINPFLAEVRRLGGTERGASAWLVEAISTGLDADDDAESLAWLCVDDELSNSESLSPEQRAALKRSLGAAKATERGITIGARVQAGAGDDHDTGRVVQIGGEYDGRKIGDNEAVIAWDSGVRTPADLNSLSPA